MEDHDSIIELKRDMKTAYNRLDDVEEDVKGIKTDNKILHEMNKNIAVLATNYEYQGKKIDCIETDIKDLKNRKIPDVSKLESDIEEIKERPAKRWELLIGALRSEERRVGKEC